MTARAHARAVRVSDTVVARPRGRAGAVVVMVMVRVVDLPHGDVLLVVVVFLGLGAETHGRFGMDVCTGRRGRRGHLGRWVRGRAQDGARGCAGDGDGYR